MIDKFRDPVSGITHLLAALLSLIGLLVLGWIGRDDLGKEISLLIYGISLVTMFSSSTIYHSYQAKGLTLDILRKIDHSSIYLLIAGTYTPICYNLFSGFWQWGLLIIIWCFAIIGITVKIFILNAPRWVTAGVYLIMGWLSVAALPEMMRVLPAGAIFWLVLGGIFFTLGAIIYISKQMDFFPGVFGFHEIWHIFVILGCLSHFILILIYTAP